ncbi:hypothetical protein [Nocardioides lijunqiniae]|uniref:hypothetical protein n=1 Tax=Nocardioides lijunqiniae TaxID=2760832 RepID=UPI0018775B02|nr:hypothetical protein [Nocardioides lijunqiniae]
MSTRLRHVAEFSYPGALFPESVTREVDQPTLDAALAVAPTETDGFFRKDGWYAVKITAFHEKRYVADDGAETWVRTARPVKVRSWVVGEKIHADDIEPTDRNRILIANIRGNSTDGYGVRTRIGNWQMASDYDEVLPASAVTR